MDVIILAGGQGTRMDHEIPKHLIPVQGKAVISYQLDYFLNSSVVNKIVIALGYRADEYISFITKQYPGSGIELSLEKEKLGTGGALKLALQKTTSNKVLVANGDDVTDIDLAKLAGSIENTICVAHPRLPFGRVLDNNGYAIFEEKPILNDWVSCGWYIFNKAEIYPLLPDNGSIEYEVFPKIKLALFKHKGFWQTVNSNKELEEFCRRKIPDCL